MDEASRFLRQPHAPLHSRWGHPGPAPPREGALRPASVETAVQTARLVLRKMSPTAVLNLSQDSVHPVAGQSPGTRGAVSTSLSLRHYPYHPVWGSIESISQKGFPPSEAYRLGKTRGLCRDLMPRNGFRNQTKLELLWLQREM